MEINEKEIKGINGYSALVVIILFLLCTLLGGIFLCTASTYKDRIVLIGTFCLGIFLIVLHCLLYILFAGFRSVKPNEAFVLTLFGKYYGTIRESGFHYVNPFAIAIDGKSIAQDEMNIKQVKIKGKSYSKTISLKVQTLVNETQKVNDKLGNPIIIGAIVVWRVSNPTKAVFNVDRYEEFLSSQADSIIRNVAHLYPYDDIVEQSSNEELTLMGSSIEIAKKMKEQLQESVMEAGLEIIEVRINQLSYSPEIAASMLQRQQAVAIIAARHKIVEGAVSMVEMALAELSDKGIIELDEERKAQMVSNLLVILCGNKDAQPIVNSGSIY